MKKVSEILIFLSISMSAYLTAKVPLRDPEHWDSWNNLDLLNEYMGGFNFGSKQLQSDSYLEKLAQDVAEQEKYENPHDFINSYPKNSNENVLVFGIKLKGNTTYKEIFAKDYNSVMEGMPGYLNFRYKNNTLNVRVVDLKELMDVARCDTLVVPLKCNDKAMQNLWRTGTGEFKFSNGNFKYSVRFNSLLKVFQAMSDDRKDRYSLDVFKNTYHSEVYRNDEYEMRVEVPDFFGSGFWSSNGSAGVWGVGDQLVTILTHVGNGIKATSNVQHQFLKVNLEINEPKVETPSDKLTNKLNDQDLRDVFESHFKTMYEMFDREQVFNSFTKYGEGYALDSNGDINIVFSLSSPVSNNVRTLDRERRLSLFNRLKLWPWFVAPPGSYSENPYSKSSLIDIWKRALGLSMGPINKDRLKDNLAALEESDPNLAQFAQNAADNMASAGKLVSPNFSSRNTNTLVVAITLSGQTRINEYSFLINENNFGQVTCFDNFSGTRHKIANLIDNQRYVCSKNSRNTNMMDNWKRYKIYGTGFSLTANGDVFMAIALTY